MSLLLKNMWRNMLKSSTSVYSVRSLSSSVSELTIPKPTDLVMGRIRTANNSAAVLAAVQQNLAQLDHRHMLAALRTLFELQRTARSEEDSERLVNDPAFTTFCQNFKRHARELDLNETIEAIKVLSYLQVQVDSLIVQTMLQLIRSNINFINIRQVIFLDFLLSKFERNHLVDALKLALPLVFQIHLPMELDHQDLRLLKDMLSFACTHDLPDRCINNIVTALLLHDQAIDAQIARSIIWSLCDVNCTEEVYPTRVQLLHICYDILSMQMEKLSFDDLLRTTAKIKGRILEKHPEYYHEQLMDAAAKYVVTREVGFEKALLVARVMSRIAHTNLGLIEYLCQLAAAEPALLSRARVNVLFGFVNCLSNSNHVPPAPAWDQLRGCISENPVLDARTTALPWTKFCLELASLGHYDDKLLGRVFSPEFLRGYLSREDNMLDYLQLLTLHEATRTFHSTEYSLPERSILRRARELYPVNSSAARVAAALERGVGGEGTVATGVALPSGIVADVLMCIKGGYPVSLNTNISNINDKTKTPIQELNLPQDGLVVCILNFNQGCFSMNSNRLRGTFRLLLDILEQQGYVTVPINVNEWSRAPPHEQTPYLVREVSYKCGEVGTKLCAT